MNKVLLVILCFLLPPLAVFLKAGANKDFLINLLLTLFTLGILGVLHALWFILKDD